MNLKELLKNKPNSLPINHLAAILTDVQKCIYLHIKEKECVETINFIRNLKLKHKIIGSSKLNKNIKEKLYDVLIAKEKKYIIKAEKKFKKPDITWAVDLGYPECCVTSFIKWSQKYYLEMTIIEYIYKNSPFKLFSFLLNNITNFFSRTLGQDRIHFNNFNNKRILFDRINLKITKKIDYDPIILWHPCSYECKESLKKAREIFYFFLKLFPEYANFKRNLFSKFIIFKNDFNFFFVNVNYKINNDKIIITEIEPINLLKTFVKKEEIKKIKLPYEINKNKKSNNFIIIPFSKRI